MKGVHFYMRSQSFYSACKMSLPITDRIIISQEGITGNWYKERGLDLSCYERFCQGIDNLCSIFNEPKIIVFFREPSSFIYSSYKQLLNEGGTLSYNEFLTQNNIDLNDTVSLNQFKFSKFINYLTSKLPESRYMLCSQEMLLSNPHRVTLKIHAFLGLKICEVNLSQFSFEDKSNPSVSEGQINLLIRLNKVSGFMKKYFGFKPAIQFKHYRLTPQLFVRHFMKNNRKDKPEIFRELKAYFKNDWEHCQELINYNFNLIGKNADED